MSYIINSYRFGETEIPKTVAGLVAWYIFSVSDDLNLSGTDVLDAYDLSGNNHDLAAQTGSEPTFSSGGGYIEGGIMEATTNPFYTDDFNVFYVASRNSVTGSAVRTWGSQQAGSASTRYAVGIHPTVFRPQLTAPSFSYTASTPLTCDATAYELHEWSHIESTATSYVNLDNGTEQSGSPHPSVTDDALRDTTLFNATGTATRYKELIMYDNRLSASDRTKIKDYLNDKYSIY